MAPFFVGAIVVLLLGAYFFYLRFSDKPIPSTKPTAVTNPFRYLPRFFSQPRMMLVYLLCAMRSGWWTMYFIYVPIFCVTVGFGETIGGALVSLATSFVMATPLLRGTIQRFGIRRILLLGYCGAGLITLGIGASMGDTLAGSDIDTARSVICRFVRLGRKYAVLPSREILGTLRNGHGIRELSFHLKPYFPRFLFGRPRHLPTGGSIHLHRIWNAGRKLANALYSHANAVTIEMLPRKLN